MRVLGSAAGAPDSAYTGLLKASTDAWSLLESRQDACHDAAAVPSAEVVHVALGRVDVPGERLAKEPSGPVVTASNRAT